MNIQSKFKDYYDCGMQYGFDEGFVYRRYKQEVYLDHITFPLRLIEHVNGANKRFYREDKNHYNDVLIGFCGNIYFARVERRINGHIEDAFYPEDNIVYDEPYLTFKEKNPRTYFKAQCNWIFDHFKCPLFSITYEVPSSYRDITPKLTINDGLKKYYFQRVFDPIAAYQEIRMFLSNMAMPEKPIPAISNKDMIEAKGFDLKTSFRKQKA